MLACMLTCKGHSIHQDDGSFHIPNELLVSHRIVAAGRGSERLWVSFVVESPERKTAVQLPHADRPDRISDRSPFDTYRTTTLAYLISHT
jgi:hypothetical protein